MNPIFLILLTAIVGGQILRIPLDFGGVLLLDLVIFALTIFGLINLKCKLKKPPLLIKLAGLFVFVCLISLLLTPLNLGLDQALLSFSYIVRLFFYFLFGWVIYSGGIKQFRENILGILKSAGIVMALVGLIQVVIFLDLGFLVSNGWDPHYFRLVSTFLDPNFTSAFLVLSLLLLSDKKWQFLVVYLALLLTFSRSGYLMFLVSFLVQSFLLKSIKMAGTTILLFLVLLTGFFIYTQTITIPRNVDRTQSAQYRINSWNQGWEIFSQNPIFGVGFNSYRYALIQYNLATDQFIQTRGSTSNDSSLLYVASTTGIIGLISFMALIGAILKISFVNNKYIFAGLIGLLVHSLFANSLFYPPILLWIILLLSSNLKRKDS